MSKPPLGYNYASYSASGYDDHVRVIDMVSAAGFRWITLTPTWRVEDRQPLRIDDTHTPTVDRMTAVAAYAASKRMNVRLDPHLDWAATFGGPEDWRRRMYFNPDDSGSLTQYDQRVVEPMMDVIVDVAARFPERCFALTLGSELDVSLLEFATGGESWASLLDRLKGLRTIAGLDSPMRLVFGQKINHDTLTWDRSLIASLNTERGKHGLAALTDVQVAGKRTQVYAYFSSLDYVSFSFYPVTQFRKPNSAVADDAWWRGPTTQADIDAVAATFKGAADDLRATLQQHTSPTPAFNIGEFGLGNTDPDHSYTTDHRTFLDANGHMDAGAREMRRKFYLGFLRFLELHGDDFRDALIAMDCRLPQVFWTTGHYDFLGRDMRPPLDQFRDNRIIQAVADYAGVSSSSGGGAGGSTGFLGPTSPGGSASGSGSGSAPGNHWVVPPAPAPAFPLIGPPRPGTHSLMGTLGILASVRIALSSALLFAWSRLRIAVGLERESACARYNGPPRHVVCVEPTAAREGTRLQGRLLDQSIDFTRAVAGFLEIRMTMVWYGHGPAGAITLVIPGRYIKVLGAQELEFEIPRGYGVSRLPPGEYQIFFYYWPFGWTAPGMPATIRLN